MNKKEKQITDKKRIGIIKIDESTTNEQIMDMVYRDFSAKLDILSSANPYLSKCDSLFAYHLISIFEVDKPIKYNYEIDTYSDTFEECEKAFEDNIFNVPKDFFGRGEWPIILIEVYKMNDKPRFVSYTITR